MIEFKSPLYSAFSGELEGLVRFLDYGNEKLVRRERELTLQHFHRMHPCCPPEVLREGLNFVMERSRSGRVVYPLYELSECRDDERKKDVRLFAFASEESKNKPAVIVCAGGGYGYVCNVVEGFPVAMRFARLGYPVFVLNYRVGRAPAVPMAMEDLERAVRFVLERGASFGGNGEYVLCGFSAGGNLITQWGTDNLGYPAHRLQPPKALLAIYPAISGEALFSDLRHRGFLKTMFGENFGEKTKKEYDVPSHCGTFPPTYMAVGKHDLLISKKPLEAFRTLLQEKGIAAQLDIFPHAPHGFGDGSSTGAEGWIGRADAFLAKLWRFSRPKLFFHERSKCR